MHRVLVIAALTALTAVATDAAPLTFFGEDLGAGEFVRLGAHPIADSARGAFVANLSMGVVTEDFEGFSPTVPPTAGPQSLALTFGPDTATLVGNGLLVNSPSGTNNPDTPTGPRPSGVYPISGDQYFLSFGTYELTFSSPQAAFGFYAVDTGDNGGQMSLEFLLVGGGSIVESVPHTAPAPGGSVIYFGFINTGNPFTGVRFLGSSVADGFAFDEMTIARVGQVSPIPEPGTFVLFGVAAVGAYVIRRRRKAS